MCMRWWRSAPVDHVDARLRLGRLDRRVVQHVGRESDAAGKGRSLDGGRDVQEAAEHTGCRRHAHGAVVVGAAPRRVLPCKRELFSERGEVREGSRGAASPRRLRTLESGFVSVGRLHQRGYCMSLCHAWRRSGARAQWSPDSWKPAVLPWVLLAMWILGRFPT